MRRLRRPGSGRCVLPLTLPSAHTSLGQSAHGACAMWTERSNHQAPLQIQAHTQPASSAPPRRLDDVSRRQSSFLVGADHPQTQKFMSSHYALLTSPKGRQPLCPSNQESTGRCSTTLPEAVHVRRSQLPEPHLACEKSTSRLSSSAVQSRHSDGWLHLAFG